jgi:hypothetical protein
MPLIWSRGEIVAKRGLPHRIRVAGPLKSADGALLLSLSSAAPLVQRPILLSFDGGTPHQHRNE